MVLTAGQQVGSYKIVKEIAHGQFAIIYKATHSILTSRVVALKLLYTTKVGSEQEIEQIFQEARILEQLQHPHILPVIDTNVFEHHPYTITEFAAHGSLRERLRKQKGQPMPLAEALDILGQIGEGLQFAHDHKIVHSDIKPENMLFNASNSIRIADFDIARTLQRANAQTASMGGTPSYMAPEQFQGKVRKESDQYALGCIAYEMLTGTRPFKGEDLAALTEAHLHGTPQPPSQLNREVSPGMEQAILRALSKKYTERFESVAAFIQALTTAPVGQHQSTERTARPSEHTEHTARHGEQLVLKGGQRQQAAREGIYYEKTVVEEEAPVVAKDDPFAAVTVVDGDGAVKRRTTRKASAEVRGTAPATPARVVKRKVDEEDEPDEIKARTAKAVKRKMEPVEDVEPVARTAKVTKKKVEPEEEEPHVAKARKASGTRSEGTGTVAKKAGGEVAPLVVHKAAFIAAREAIMPKQQVQPEVKGGKTVGGKKGQEEEEKRGVVVRKRTGTKGRE